jgi:nucleotide-binding universal stress UspA family protein
MFDTLLVGVDGRPGGRDAIALAAQLVSPEGRIRLVHVYSDRRIAGPRMPDATDQPEAAESLLAREARVAEIEADSIAIADPSPGRTLHRLAQRDNADLLVVGSSHRGALGRVLLGDETLAALNGAPCAVAIAPAGYAVNGRDMLTIGIGHDGSPESELALLAARSLAGRQGSRLRALAVVSLQSVGQGSDTPLDWTEQTELVIKDERARLQAIDGVEGEVVYGDPSEELAAFAKELDLLIVGSRSNGPLGRLLNGSTSTYLARRCPCPLLVLPRALIPSAPAAPDGPSRDPLAPAPPPSGPATPAG